MYILREIIEKTIFPKSNQNNSSRYLYVGSSGRCSIRLLGSIYSCNRIYLNPKAILNYFFNKEELKIIMGGKDKIIEHGNRNPAFKTTFINAGKKTEETRLFLHDAINNFKKIYKDEPDAYLINCLTREGQFMGATTACNIKIFMISKGMMSLMRSTYGENFDDMAGAFGRDLIMSREIPARPVSPVSPVSPVVSSAFDEITNRFISQRMPSADMASFSKPTPINFIPNNDSSYLKNDEIQYIVNNGLLDIKDTINFENEKTLKKGSGYYITKSKEIGDSIPIIKFKGKLNNQFVEIEEDQQINDLENKTNQIPTELLGNEIEYNNPILNLEL